MNISEFVIKENSSFRLRVKIWKCVSPNNLNSIDFIQECLEDGEIQTTSIYNYFLTDEEVKVLANTLLTTVVNDSKVNE